MPSSTPQGEPHGGELRLDGLDPGSRFGAYRIVRELGRGGMGVVYEATSELDGRPIALKLLGPGLVDDAESRARFLREGRMAAGVMHQNAVYVYGTAEVNGTPVIAMELVSGGTLESLIERDGPLPVSDVLMYARQLVDGLEAAASAGVLHRDVKPSNCFVAGPGQVKIGDFGLSRPSVRTADVRLTQTGSLMGTPAFAAPEQLLGEALDQRADIYSLGATLWFLLTGRTPFGGVNAPQLLAAVLQGRLPSLEAQRPDVPPALAALLARCLAREPNERIGSYSELRAELAEVEASGEPAGPWQRLGASVVDSASLGMPALALVRVWPALPPSVEFATCLLSYLIGKALPEHRTGRSLGKLLFGLRLVSVTGRLPSRAVSIQRALLWSLILDWESLGSAVFKWDLTEPSAIWAAGVVIPFLLMLPMRRSNGYASGLDFLLRTRVIRHRRAPSPFRFARAAPRPLGEVGEGETAGPYELGATVFERPDRSRVRVAFDSELLRTVWVHQVQPGTPAVTAARRQLARAGRLRWLAGEREAGGGWDAYGAPEGTALLDFADAVAWSRCAGWLDDIAQELVAAAASGEQILPLVGDIWIAEGDQAMLIDLPSASAPLQTNAGIAGAGSVLQMIARRALIGASWRAAEPWPPLPISVRQWLRQLHAATDLIEIVIQLRELKSRPDRVTRRQFLRARALLLLPCAIVSLIHMPDVWKAFSVTPEQRAVVNFLEFIERADEVIADSAESLARAIREGAGSEALVTQGHARWIASYRNEALTVERWLRARHGLVLADSSAAQQVARFHTPGDSARVAARMVRMRTISRRIDDDFLELAAIQRVEQAWNGRPPRWQSWRLEPWNSVFMSLFYNFIWLLGSAFASLGVALLFGRGAIYRSAGIAFANADGAPATRAQILWRVLVNWSPFLLATPLWLMLTVAARASEREVLAFPETGSSPEIVTLAALLLGGMIALRIWWNPARTPGDVVAGTWIVPE